MTSANYFGSSEVSKASRCADWRAVSDPRLLIIRMVVGSFFLWNSDGQLDGFPDELRNCLEGIPGETWLCLRKDIPVDTGRPIIARASEGTPCFVVPADVDADFAAAYSVPHVCRSRSAALYIPDWFWSETEDYHTSTCLLYTSPSPRDRSLSRMPSSA